MSTVLILVMSVTSSKVTHKAPYVWDGGQMEEPQYEEINEMELREIEAALGHPVTREIAQWFIRNRMNREAVERMLEAPKGDRGQNVREIGKTREHVSIPKKRRKKCA